MLTLKLGANVPEVWLLKVWLNGLPSTSPKIPLDEPFGPNTKIAVAKFQAIKGLSADGVVGPMTWRELAQAVKFVAVPASDLGNRPSQFLWPMYLRDLKKCPVNAMRFRSAFNKTFGTAEGSRASGLEKLIQFINADRDLMGLRFAAYLLATTKRESGHVFEPVIEEACRTAGDQGDCPHYQAGPPPKFKYCKALACPNSDPPSSDPMMDCVKLRGVTQCPNNKSQHIYHGRGYIQLTWYGNYAGMEDRLGIKLVHFPENALVAEIAYKIISSWVQRGPPGSTDKLSDYISSESWEKSDYFNARDVINKDKNKLAWPGATFTVGKEIEDYAKKLEVCLAYGMGTFFG